MTGQKFSHFEIFKIVINTLYIIGGVFVFGITISNAAQEFKKPQWKTIYEQEQVKVQCQNCDEID